MKIWAGMALAFSHTQYRCRAICIYGARSKQEALGAAFENALESLPPADGWAEHIVDVHEVAQDAILEAARSINENAERESGE